MRVRFVAALDIATVDSPHGIAQGTPFDAGFGQPSHFLDIGIHEQQEQQRDEGAHARNTKGKSQAPYESQPAHAPVEKAVRRSESLGKTTTESGTRKNEGT